MCQHVVGARRASAPSRRRSRSPWSRRRRTRPSSGWCATSGSSAGTPSGSDAAACGVRAARYVSRSSSASVGAPQVARQHLRVGAHVGDALHVGVAAQRVDAAARAAHVAEQQLDHRHRADVLRADRVLRPAERVEDRHHLVGRRRVGRSSRRSSGTGPSACRVMLLTMLRRVARSSASSAAGTRTAGSACVSSTSTKPSSPIW